MAADALANLFYSTSTQCSSPQPRFTVNGNNQFTGTGIGYDLAGDMTADTVYSYTYDAENRLITASGMTNGPYCYTYDGNGMRVMKAHASGGSCTGSVTVDMLYWRSTSGDTITETDGSGSTTNSSYNEYIFFAAWAGGPAYE
jgi:YD repeat-containing protein